MSGSTRQRHKRNDHGIGENPNTDEETEGGEDRREERDRPEISAEPTYYTARYGSCKRCQGSRLTTLN